LIAVISENLRIQKDTKEKKRKEKKRKEKRREEKRREEIDFILFQVLLSKQWLKSRKLLANKYSEATSGKYHAYQVHIKSTSVKKSGNWVILLVWIILKLQKKMANYCALEENIRNWFKNHFKYFYIENIYVGHQ
jgi:hypothetical protein